MIPLRTTIRSYTTPTVTLLLVVANVMAFFYELQLGPYALNRFVLVNGLVPYHLHPFSLVTSMFLHGGWLHLLGNMWFLWIFGQNMEDELGHWKFLAFYVICGIVAGLAHVLINWDSTLPTVGASGAIAGVMGGYLIVFPRARIITLVFLGIFFTTLELPAMIVLVLWLLTQFFGGIGSLEGYANASRGGVAWFAHVGGFLAGMLLVLWVRRPRYRPSEY